MEKDRSTFFTDVDRLYKERTKILQTIFFNIVEHNATYNICQNISHETFTCKLI